MAWSVQPQDGVEICGSATAFPSELAGAAHRFDNASAWRALWGAEHSAQLEARGWSVERPLESWGVAFRDWAAPPRQRAAMDVVDLAAAAGERALLAARVTARELDAIILATSTPSRVSRSDAHRLATRLHTQAACWDLKAGGGGGLLAMVQAALAVRAGASAVLVVAVEVATPYLPVDEPAMWALYGDGAAAFVLRPGRGGLLGARIAHESIAGRAMTIRGALPPEADSPFRAQAPDRQYQDGLVALWDRTIDQLAELRAASEAASTARESFLYAPYGVTRSQVERTAKRLGVGADETVTSLRDHGCVGCAGALVAWHAARSRSKADANGGRYVASAAVGGGVSRAATLWCELEEQPTGLP